MPMYGFAQGALDYLQQQRQDEAQKQQQAIQQAYLAIAQQQAAQQAADKKRQLEAQGYAAQYLPQLFAGMAGPGGGGGAPPGLPPPPGTPAGGPQAPGPGQPSQPMQPPQGGFAGMPPSPLGGGGPPPGGGGMPPQPPGAGAGRSAGPGGPGMLPPYRPMPQAGGSGLQAPPGALPPPPGGGQAPQQPAQPQVPDISPDQAAQSFMSIAKSMQAAGIPAQMQMEALSALEPYYKMVADQQDRALQRKHQQQMDIFAAIRSKTDTENKESLIAARDERLRQNQEKINLLKQRASSTGGKKMLLSDEDKAFLADMWIQDKSSLGWIPKENRIEIETMAAQRSRAGGQTAFDVGAGRSAYKADTQAYGKLDTFTTMVDQQTRKMELQIKVLEEYMQKGVAGTVFKKWNDWVQGGRRQINDPDVTRLDTAIQTVADDYARIKSGPLSNAQLHEGTRKDAQKIINDQQDMPAMKAALEVMLKDAKAQGQSSKEERKKISDRLARRTSEDDDEPGSSPTTTSGGATVSNWH